MPVVIRKTFVSLEETPVSMPRVKSMPDLYETDLDVQDFLALQAGLTHKVTSLADDDVQHTAAAAGADAAATPLAEVDDPTILSTDAVMEPESMVLVYSKTFVSFEEVPVSMPRVKSMPDLYETDLDVQDFLALQARLKHKVTSLADDWQQLAAAASADAAATPLTVVYDPAIRSTNANMKPPAPVDLLVQAEDWRQMAVAGNADAAATPLTEVYDPAIRSTHADTEPPAPADLLVQVPEDDAVQVHTGGAARKPPPQVSIGSLAHPQACRRPCMYIVAGQCHNGVSCGFCHLSHARQPLCPDQAHRNFMRKASLAELIVVVLRRLEGKVAVAGYSRLAAPLLQVLHSGVVNQHARLLRADETAYLKALFRKMSIGGLVQVILNKAPPGAFAQSLMQEFEHFRMRVAYG